MIEPEWEAAQRLGRWQRGRRRKAGGVEDDDARCGFAVFDAEYMRRIFMFHSWWKACCFACWLFVARCLVFEETL
jgi:hypothetical protein